MGIFLFLSCILTIPIDVQVYRKTIEKLIINSKSKGIPMRIQKYLPFESMFSLPFLDFYPKMAIPVLEGLVCLEGANYIGKTTVTALLKENLIGRGLRVKTIKQPLNTDEVVRELNAINTLIGRNRHHNIMDLKQEVFRKDRDTVDRLLYAIYKDFDIILMDRGPMSTAVCQGKPYSFLSMQAQLTFTLVSNDTSILVERSKNRPDRGTLDVNGLELDYRNKQYRVYSDLLADLFYEKGYPQYFGTMVLDSDYGNNLSEIVSVLAENIMSNCLTTRTNQ